MRTGEVGERIFAFLDNRIMTIFCSRLIRHGISSLRFFAECKQVVGSPFFPQDIGWQRDDTCAHEQDQRPRREPSLKSPASIGASSGPARSRTSLRLFHDWTDKWTVFADGHDIPPDIQAHLARRKIPVVDGRIVEIARHKGHIGTVNLDARPNIAVDILFAHPRNKPSASLHESLGLATVDTPVGIALKVDERRQTNISGIYAAGDLTTPFLPSVMRASSQGAMAGNFAQQSMLV